MNVTVLIKTTSLKKSNAIKKNIIFQTSGLPLIRLRYSPSMDYERLKEEIKQTTKEFLLEIQQGNNSESKRILKSFDLKKFDIYNELPNINDIQDKWSAIVGELIAENTIEIQMLKETGIVIIFLSEKVKSIVEMGKENIKKSMYQEFPVLNALEFKWESSKKRRLNFGASSHYWGLECY
ncbi:hypothetical protein ACT7C2_24635 [Bacillus pacificus]